MYRILVPVDIDETRADDVVETLVDLPLDASAVEVVVLNVFQEIESAGDIGGGVDTAEFYEDVELPESVTRVADTLRDHGLSTTVDRGHGDPKSVIVSYVDDEDVDHVVMAGEHRSPAGKAVFGSVTQSVILNAGVPVTVSVTSA